MANLSFSTIDSTGKDEESAHVSTHDVNEKLANQGTQEDSAPFKHTWSLWCIFAVLCLFSFLSALDGTIITTSLPTITGAIGGGNDGLYVWIAQCFIFASTAPQPLYGQLANIFGRRNPFLVAIALFTLGSGVSGGASSPAMLIAGRTVQGTGAAGLYVLSDIIICDLVPPRYRGPYLTAVLSTAGIGSTIGPVIGGTMAESNWRWIFYLNVPISVVGAIVLILLLKVNYVRSPTWAHALARVDYLGALIFIPSTISIFYALITGGVEHPWSSWRVILPLVLGILGWVLYHVQQSYSANPSTPSHLFTNRTSITGFALVFLSSVVLYTISFFLPIYFQGVKLVSPLMSGVYYLPFALAIIPFAGFSGWALSKWGQYIPLHYAGTALVATGAGLLATLDGESSHAAWIGLQIIPSAGIAMIYTAALPSTLAPLKEEDVATATATYSFIRSFGFVWGVTMGGIVFNGQINARVHLVQDEGLQASLRNGAAYAFAAGGERLSEIASSETLEQVISVYAGALRAVWFVVMGVGLLAFVLVPLQRAIELKKENNTSFNMETKDTGSTEV
ncbi:major facilitator superfamily domain-containing protein [Boeremia exigua]|uniref:major facilitator superfamily domain-containing protein n=1 Tax=Boeremia exigua TaxID=749465 RepID=UPI001E8DDFBB|nr:major facilitator superfamily domain-containing protein [Boeremia exigua]KAH6644887.1 major facilitator superfamily domain-containing protein [Boeremia exigua]